MKGITRRWKITIKVAHIFANLIFRQIFAHVGAISLFQLLRRSDKMDSGGCRGPGGWGFLVLGFEIEMMLGFRVGYDSIQFDSKENRTKLKFSGI